METELSFLLTLLFDHKIPKKAQEVIKDRIKKLEANPQTVPRSAIVMPPMQIPQVAAPMQTPEGKPLAPQSPSTQALLEKHGLAQPAAPMAPPPLTHPALAAMNGPVDKETGRPMVATGRGTSGPRKF